MLSVWRAGTLPGESRQIRRRSLTKYCI